MVLSILLLLLTRLAASIYAKAPGIYLDRFTFGSLTSPSIWPLYTTYPITWLYNLKGTHCYALSLSKFKFQSGFISYEADLISVTRTTATLQIHLKNFNSSLSFIDFSIIVVTEIYDYFQLIPVSRNVGSMGPNGFGDYVSTFNIVSNKFVLGSGPPIQIFCLRQSILLNSTSISKQEIRIDCKPLIGSPNIEVKLTANSNNYIESLKINLLLIQAQGIEPNIAQYSRFTVSTFVPAFASTLLKNYGIPVHLFGQLFTTDSLCLYGLYNIETRINGNPVYYDKKLTGGNLLHLLYSISNILTVEQLALCLGQCPSNTFAVSSYTCQSCHHHIPFCLQCYSQNNCSLCSYGRFFSAELNKCQLCKDYHKYCEKCTNSSVCLSCLLGNLVIGGCTKTVGCIEVGFYYNFEGPQEMCLQCDSSEFKLDRIKNLCVCKQGWIAGRHCISVPGCIATQKIGTVAECIFCNTSLSLRFDNQTKKCVCQSGLYLEGFQCNDICGDGKVITLECDDQNTDDGDGCSSSCKTELYYRCETKNSSTPSVCQYVGPKVSITLLQTQRSRDINQGVFTFAISPPLSILSKLDLADYFTFDCRDALHQVSNWIYSEGKILVYVDYQTNLEGKQAVFNFTFNQQYIRSEAVLIDLTVKSDGVMLLIAKGSSEQAILKYLLLGTAIFGLCLFFIGSFFQQMIGVQLIFSLQIIFYIHFTASRYTPMLSSFQQLSLVGFSCLFIKERVLNVRIDLQYQKAGFSIQQSQLTLAAIFSYCLGLVILSLILLCLSTTISKNIQTWKNRCFDCLQSPFAQIALLPLLFLSLTLNQQRPGNYFLPKVARSLIILICLGLVSFFYARNFVRYISSKRYSDKVESESSVEAKVKYGAGFEVYHLFSTLTVICWVFFRVELCWFVLLGIEIGLFVWLLLMKPYAVRCFDSFTVLMHPLLIIIFQVYLILKKGAVINDVDQDLVFLMGIAIFIAAYEILIFCRLILVIKCKIKAAPQQQQSLKDAEVATERKDSSRLFNFHEERNRKKYTHFIQYITQQLDRKQRLISKETRVDQNDQNLSMLKKRMREKLRKKKKQHNLNQWKEQQTNGAATGL